MLTTVLFPSLRLDRLIAICYHLQIQIMDFSASLIGGHVVLPYQTDLDSGNSPMRLILESLVPLHHFTETEEIMEQST